MKKKNYGVLMVLLLSILFSLCPSTISFAKNEKPTKIVLSESSKTIYTNQSITLKVKSVSPKNASKDVKWYSSDKKVAKVSAKGKVTGVKAGTATIKAVSKKDKKVKAVCKIKVVNFKSKTLNAKKTCVISFRPYLETTGKNYRVIESYKELQNFKEEIRKEGVATDDIAIYGSASAFEEKLNSYKKSYFKSKVLCVMEGSTSSGSRKVKVGDLKLTQSKSGKVCASLYVSEVKPKKDETCDMAYQQYFVEINKKDADTIQSYRIVQK